MTKPQYATTPDHPTWHGNTDPSYIRPITPPATDAASLERADILLELRGALIGAASIAKLLGTKGLRDYEITLDAMLGDVRAERRAILEGDKG